MRFEHTTTPVSVLREAKSSILVGHICVLIQAHELVKIPISFSLFLVTIKYFPIKLTTYSIANCKTVLLLKRQTYMGR